MKITIEIGGKDYTFEMNRWVYKQLLADEEYAKIQGEITKRLKDKKGDAKKAVKEVQEEMLDEDMTALILHNMVMEEQVFCHSLSINHPELSWEERISLIDVAYNEYGPVQVPALCTKLMENFTQRGEEPKKKMVMRMG